MTFDAVNTHRNIQVPIVNDNVPESVESFFATLSVDSSVYPAVNIGTNRTDIVIRNDDGKELINSAY